MVDGEIIGLACVRADGEAAVAVVEEWRGHGVATALLRAVIVRGASSGTRRIFIRSSHRSRAVAAIGDALGGTVVDLGRGRIELVFDVRIRRPLRADDHRQIIGERYIACYRNNC